MKKPYSSHIFLPAKKGLSNHDIGVAGGTSFQEIWPGTGFKIGDFVKEQLVGGATAVERLISRFHLFIYIY